MPPLSPALKTREAHPIHPGAETQPGRPDLGPEDHQRQLLWMLEIYGVGVPRMGEVLNRLPAMLGGGATHSHRQWVTWGGGEVLPSGTF